MNLQSGNNRVLDPLERFSEIVFGLIMVLSFTCAVSVAEAARADLRAMLIGAIGCNLAWGIIDGAFYLIACLAVTGRHAAFLRQVQQSTDPVQVRGTIADAMPQKVADALQAADFARIEHYLRKIPAPARTPRLTMENWRGALGVFLLVFVSTFPVVVPFIFFRDAHLALRVSNAVAIALLFGAGHMLARYAGLRPFIMGAAMVFIGAVLVALTIALGG
jgi:hypothetical protein